MYSMLGLVLNNCFFTSNQCIVSVNQEQFVYSEYPLTFVFYKFFLNVKES